MSQTAKARRDVKFVMELYGVGQSTVLGWIASGALRAIDVSPKAGGKPQWRIAQEAIDEFEAARTKAAPAPKPASPSRRKQSGNVKFY